MDGLFGAAGDYDPALDQLFSLWLYMYTWRDSELPSRLLRGISFLLSVGEECAAGCGGLDRARFCALGVDSWLAFLGANMNEF